MPVDGPHCLSAAEFPQSLSETAMALAISRSSPASAAVSVSTSRFGGWNRREPLADRSARRRKRCGKFLARCLAIDLRRSLAAGACSRLPCSRWLVAATRSGTPPGYSRIHGESVNSGGVGWLAAIRLPSSHLVDAAVYGELLEFLGFVAQRRSNQRLVLCLSNTSCRTARFLAATPISGRDSGRGCAPLGFGAKPRHPGHRRRTVTIDLDAAISKRRRSTRRHGRLAEQRVRTR